AGKSTTLNYLLGHTMGYKEGGINPVIEVKKALEGVDIAGIGHELGQSQTKVPQVFTSKKYTFFYVDTPGLHDTSGEEAALAHSISINQYIKYAKSVKAIFCVVSVPNLKSGRGKVFVTLLKEINLLLGNVLNHMPNIFWLFTKLPLPNTTQEGLMNEIKKLRKSKLEIQNTIKQRHKEDWKQVWEQKEDKVALDITSSIIEYSNVFPIYPVDNGGSRQKVLKRLDQIENSISKNEFHIPEENVPGNIQKILANEEIVKKNLLGRSFRIQQKIERDEKELEELQFVLEQKEIPPSYIQKKTKQKEDEKKAYKKELEAVEKEIITIKKRSEETVLYRKYKREVSSYFFGDKAKIRYDDLPFEKDSPQVCYIGGSYKVETHEPEKGLFVAKYTLPIDWGNLATVGVGATVISGLGGNPVAAAYAAYGTYIGVEPLKGNIQAKFYVKNKYIDEAYLLQFEEQLEGLEKYIAQVNGYIERLKKDTKKACQRKKEKLEKELPESRKLYEKYQKIFQRKSNRMRFIENAYQLIKGYNRDDGLLDLFVKHYATYQGNEVCEVSEDDQVCLDK
ncbi:MAG: hypothetical protein AAF335_04505, partial [Bacteroidota bacterium]